MAVNDTLATRPPCALRSLERRSETSESPDGKLEGYAYLATRYGHPGAGKSAYASVGGKDADGNRFQTDCRIDYDTEKGRAAISVMECRSGRRRAFAATLLRDELPKELRLESVRAHSSRISKEAAEWVVGLPDAKPIRRNEA